MVEFHEWLRKTRKSENLHLEDLQRLSRVNVGSISRVENEKTQPTLQTVVRLVSAFEVSPSVVLEEIGVNVAVKIDKEKLSADNVIDFDLYKTWLRGYLERPDDRISLIERWLGKFQNVDFPRGRELPDSESVLKLLMLGDDSLEYPLFTDESFLLDMYQQGESIHFFDVGHYLHLIRTNRQERLIDVKAATDIAVSLLHRIERGSTELIKFNLLQTLSNHLKDEGIFILACWRAAEVHNATQEIIEEFVKDSKGQSIVRGQVSIIMKLYRWAMFCELGDDYIEQLIESSSKESKK